MLIEHTVSDGSVNYVPPTLRSDTSTEIIIITVGSILGGVILLLLIAIILLPLIVLTCHRVQSRHFKIQK